MGTAWKIRAVVGAASAALLLALARGAVAVPARADSWALPQQRTYHSPNRRFAIEVTPKKLESQLKYFSDKVENRPDAGAAAGVKDNRCKGVFLELRDGSYVRRAAFPLVNEVSPVSALVADSGRYVVTFDNWHAAGYGDDVVVIYRADGTLVRKLGLADFLTEADIRTLPHTVSSIWWGGEHYLDEPAGHLVLRVVADGEMDRGEQGEYQELRIVLETGAPVAPKRDLLTNLQRQMSPEFVVRPTAEGADGAADSAPPRDPPCLPDEAEGAARLAAAELFDRAVLQVTPVYPPIAQAARATGKVVVEVLIEGGGDVVCARAVSGHPLLRQVSAGAARSWKFKPREGGGRQFGRIAFDFDTSPPGEKQE